MAGKVNVGTVYGGIELDNKGFKVALEQSKGAMAKSALEMQRSSRVKIDTAEWKKLTSQMRALQARAQETRIALLKATPGSEEAKKLSNELGGLQKRLKLLKDTAEPTRKELERMARAERDAAKSSGRGPDIAGMAGALPGGAGAIASTAISQPEVAAIMAAGAAITAVAGGFVALSVASTKAAADMEMSMAAFRGLLGSAQKARQFMGQLQSFAAKTPFEMPGLIENTKLLMAFGFEAKRVLPILRVVGDAASYMGGGEEQINRIVLALGKMKAKGKVSADEMLQITEAGINGWAMLAKAIGTDMPTAMKKAEKGQIDWATGVNAILSGMNEQFGGGMDIMSQTLIGKWSTIKDEFRNKVLIPIGEPIVNWLKPRLDSLVAWFQANWPKILAIGKKWVAEWKPALTSLWQAIQELWKIIEPFVNKLAKANFALIVAALRSMAWSADKLAKALKTTRELMEWIKDHPLAGPLGAAGAFFDFGKDKPKSKPRKRKSGKSKADPAAGSFLSESSSPTTPETEGMAEAVRLEEQYRRAIALNGDASETAAAKYDLYQGALSKLPESEKRVILALAAQKDAQDKAREAAEKHKKTIEDAAKAQAEAVEKAKDHQVKTLGDGLSAMREWAGKMADSMKTEANSVLDILKDQFKKEQDLRNQDAEDKKNRYEKLKELGRAGAMAMTGIAMFKKSEKDNRDMTAGDVTQDKIRSAQEQYRQQRANEIGLTRKVSGTLYGNSIAQYENIANSKTADMFGKSLDQQVQELTTLVGLTQQMLQAIQNNNKQLRTTTA